MPYADPQKRREAERRRRAADPEKARAKCRKWHGANKERENARSLTRRNANLEVARAACRQWYASNPDRNRAKCASRRSTKMEATLPWFPPGWDEEIYEQAAAQRLHFDHIIPLATCRGCTPQGLHAPGNLQLLTPAENTAKGNRCQDCWRHDNHQQGLQP